MAISPKWEAVWDHVWQTGASGNVITTLREYYSGRLRNLITPHITKTSRVLELGCGTSTLLLSLAPRVQEVVGIDISSEGLKIAERHKAESNIPNARFVKADCRNVPYTNEFDVVYSAGLIEHFFEQDIDVVRQHLKALKPGGVAIMSVPYKYSLHSLHYLLTRPSITRRFWPWSQERNFQRFYSGNDLHRLGKRIGQPYRVYVLPPTLVGLLLGIIVLEIRR